MDYRIMAQDSVEETARCVTDIFLSDEPMLRALKVNPVTYLPYARFYCNAYARSGLSITARENGILAGFILCHDLAFDIFKALEKEKIEFDRDMMELLRIDGALLDDLYKDISINDDKCLHLVQMAVARPFRGRGIATALIEEALTLGRKRGFQAAISECSSSTSLHCHQKCGFSPLFSITYHTYRYKGRYPFRDLPGQCILTRKGMDIEPS